MRSSSPGAVVGAGGVVCAMFFGDPPLVAAAEDAYLAADGAGDAAAVCGKASNLSVEE